MKPFKGTINFYEIRAIGLNDGLHLVAIGELDTTGKMVRTSPIVHISKDEKKIITKNSTYLLGTSFEEFIK